jgi:hypothetical protein
MLDDICAFFGSFSSWGGTFLSHWLCVFEHWQLESLEVLIILDRLAPTSSHAVCMSWKLPTLLPLVILFLGLLFPDQVLECVLLFGYIFRRKLTWLLDRGLFPIPRVEHVLDSFALLVSGLHLFFKLFLEAFLAL